MTYFKKKLFCFTLLTTYPKTEPNIMIEDCVAVSLMRTLE